MAAQGHVAMGYWEGCNDERKRLADALRRLFGALPSTRQATRAQYLGISPGSLSSYWVGRRVPKLPQLRAMHQRVETVLAKNAPVALPELERLRNAAARRRKRTMDVNAAMNMGRAAPRQLTQPSDPGTLAAIRPAVDRHNAESLPAGTGSETVNELLAAHTAGDRRNVLGLAWSVSKTRTPEELSAIVSELDSMGHASLAEAVLLGGRERSHGEAMLLALALMGLNLTVHAETVMRAAIPHAATGHTR